MEIINQDFIVEDIPSKETLLLIDALFFAVYGWNFEKTKRLKLASLKRWVRLAKKRMTWGDCYRLMSLVERKEKSLWQKFYQKFNYNANRNIFKNKKTS